MEIKSRKSNIVVFTEYFPYGNSETFLETEIKYLAQNFNSIYIVPQKISSHKRTLPTNVYLIDDFINNTTTSKLKYYWIGIFSAFFNYLSWKNINIFSNFHVLGWLKSIKYIGYTYLLKKRIAVIINKRELDINSSVFYTYWLGYVTLALGLLKDKNNNLKVISRAHGYDLYDERGENTLAFIKKANIKLLNNLFLISEHGKNYLEKKYPEFGPKYVLSRLGTMDFQKLNPASNDDQLTIVSCSNISPVKRIHLLIDGLVLLIESNNKLKVNWFHIGDGSIKKDVIKYAIQKFNENIKYRFFGQLNNQEVFEFYAKTSIDVFINVSESEGLPVTIMEAQSFGIPVIATSVGGIPEIVNNNCGQLLSSNPDPSEIASSLSNVYNEKKLWEKKRVLSRANWKKNFNADINYLIFANYLKQILKI